MSDAANGSIRLYSYAMSPFAAKVHCFLLFKRLDFECFYINPLRVEQDLPIGRQIPVVTVGEESRADSTPIGLWLDELFPDTPRLLPQASDERAQLLDVDGWISDHLIPGSFRSYPGAGVNRLAEIFCSVPPKIHEPPVQFANARNEPDQKCRRK